MLACKFKAWDSALLLLSKGADPNKAARDKDGNVQNPLFCAISQGSIEVCRRLLECGARLENTTSSGNVKEVRQCHSPPTPQVVVFAISTSHINFQ